jgi:malate dehydrogenase
MAYAGYRFAEAVLKAHKGEKGLIEPSYVYLPGVDGGEEIVKTVGGLEFFAVPVELGVSCIEP